MPRNRRNKRNVNLNINVKDINNKEFTIIVSIFLVIIAFCAVVIKVRNYNDRLEVARQREILDMQIKAIYEDKREIATNDDNENNIDKEKKEEDKDKDKETNKDEDKKDKEETIVKSDTIINIAVVGGIIGNNELLEDAKDGDTYNFSPMFQGIEHLVKSSDLAIGTMETNLVKNEKYIANKKYNSPIEFAEDVKASGIKLVTLAHNHALDYGYDGLKETKDNLEKLGYDTVGVTTKENSDRFIVKEIKGIKIAFLSYTYGVNMQASKTKEELQYVNIYDKEKALEDIKKAKEKAKYIFVMMHWGDINSNQISKQQEDIAKFLTDNGVDVIIGAHASVVEPMEVIENENGKNKFVAYCVGNYCSYLGYEYSPLEIILNIQIRKDGKTNEVTLDKITYTPIYMLDNGKNTENRFTLVDIKDVAREYTYENSDIITKSQYNTLIKALEKVENVIRSRIKDK